MVVAVAGLAGTSPSYKNLPRGFVVTSAGGEDIVILCVKSSHDKLTFIIRSMRPGNQSHVAKTNNSGYIGYT
jgi:hypothetical protein